MKYKLSMRNETTTMSCNGMKCSTCGSNGNMNFQCVCSAFCGKEENISERFNWCSEDCFEKCSHEVELILSPTSTVSMDSDTINGRIELAELNHEIHGTKALCLDVWNNIYVVIDPSVSETVILGRLKKFYKNTKMKEIGTVPLQSLKSNDLKYELTLFKNQNDKTKMINSFLDIVYGPIYIVIRKNGGDVEDTLEEIDMTVIEHFLSLVRTPILVIADWSSGKLEKRKKDFNILMLRFDRIRLPRLREKKESDSPVKRRAVVTVPGQRRLSFTGGSVNAELNAQIKCTNNEMLVRGAMGLCLDVNNNVNVITTFVAIESYVLGLLEKIYDGSKLVEIATIPLANMLGNVTYELTLFYDENDPNKGKFTNPFIKDLSGSIYIVIRNKMENVPEGALDLIDVNVIDYFLDLISGPVLVTYDWTEGKMKKKVKRFNFFLLGVDEIRSSNIRIRRMKGSKYAKRYSPVKSRHPIDV